MAKQGGKKRPLVACVTVNVYEHYEPVTQKPVREYGWSAGPGLAAFRKKFGKVFYGSEHGGQWLLDLERMISLYLREGQTAIPSAMVERDRAALAAMRSEIQACIDSDWYTKDKLTALLKSVAEVETAMPK